MPFTFFESLHELNLDFLPLMSSLDLLQLFVEPEFFLFSVESGWISAGLPCCLCLLDFDLNLSSFGLFAWLGLREIFLVLPNSRLKRGIFLSPLLFSLEGDFSAWLFSGGGGGWSLAKDLETGERLELSDRCEGDEEWRG